VIEAVVLEATLILAQARSSPALQARETADARMPLADKIASDPDLLKAIVAKNRVVESPAEIRRIDAAWMHNPRYPLRKTLTSGPCADRLRKLIQDDKLVVEAFLMDERGGLVCATVETSDYWQGDEAKWQKTYRDGAQAFIDEPAKFFLVQGCAVFFNQPAQFVEQEVVTLDTIVEVGERESKVASAFGFWR